MNSKIRVLCATAGLAIAGVACAQPALFTDLGDLSAASGTSTVNVTLTAASDVQWFKAILPSVGASAGYVDLWTNAPGTVTDSEIGVYTNTGAFKATDDDDGPGSYSALSFGLTAPTRTGPSGSTAFNGRDGVLTQGTYWIAVGAWNTTFNTTAWSVTSAYTGAGRTLVLGWDVVVVPQPLSISASSVAPTAGVPGSTFNSFVTVGPGTVPNSTGIAVTADASAVGGGTVTLLDNGVAPDVTAGDNIFSGTVGVSGSATSGNKTITFNASDAQSRTATSTATFRVTAQPSVYTNLGDLSVASGTGSSPVTLTSLTDIQWYLAKFPAVSATNGFVDLWTATPGDITDTEIGVYSDTGAMIANDDDDADGNLSALSFGLTSPTRPAIGAGVAFNGRDGVLAGGNYWIAVGRFNVTFNATGWDVSSANTTAQTTTTLNWNIQVPGTPTAPTGAVVHAPTSGLAGSSFVSTCTVTPGQFPNSTGITVVANAASVGGGTVNLLDNGVAPDVTAGDNIFTANITSSGSATPGTYAVTYTVADAQSRSSGTSANYTIVPPPPANDTCATAATAVVGANAFTNINSTDDAGVSASCQSNSHHDVWFSFNPPSNGGYVFDTCGVGFDTVITVFSGCGGAELGCDDDTCGSLTSRIQVNNLVAGTPVLVRVAGYSSATGSGNMNITNVTPSNPSGTGSQTPAAPLAGTAVLLKVSVTPGANPASTGIAVVADLNSIGGSATQSFYDDGTNGDVTPGDNIFSYSYTLPVSQADGTYPCAFSISDAQSRSGSGTLNVTVVAAAQWDELANGLVDAGNSIATAQAAFGVGALSSIQGHFAAGEDVDMYRIQICDVSNFSATTSHIITNGQDTQMFLFNYAGTAVQMNDDTPIGSDSTSQMGNQFVTANGDYYLAVSHYNVDPLNAASAPIWENSPFDTVRAPDGTTNGGDIMLSSWSTTYASAFDYRLVMTGVCFPCIGDFNHDGGIDFFDYLDFVDAFAQGLPSADLNLDGSIDFFDYLDFVDHFTAGC